MFSTLNKKRTCISCGKTYYFCPNGNPEDKGKPTWMFICCCWECRNIDLTLTKYFMGECSLEEAVEVINSIDRTKHKFNDSIESKIQKILDQYNKENKKENKVSEKVISTEDGTSSTETSSNNTTVKKYSFSKKKKLPKTSE